MKIYEIIIVPIPILRHIGNQGHYVLAKDFDDAYGQAQKLLAKKQKTTEDAYIKSICEQFELEVVK